MFATWSDLCLHALPEWTIVRQKLLKQFLIILSLKINKKNGKADPHSNRVNGTTSRVSWFREHHSATKSKQGEFLLASYSLDANSAFGKSLSGNDLNKAICELNLFQECPLKFQNVCDMFMLQRWVAFLLNVNCPFLLALQVFKCPR